MGDHEEKQAACKLAIAALVSVKARVNELSKGDKTKLEELIMGDPLWSLKARIKEQECLLAQIDRHLEVFSAEMKDLRAEEAKLRNGENWFLSERVTSLRMRQVKCAACIAQTTLLFAAELKNERGLIQEYDCAVAEAKAKAEAKRSKRKALPRLASYA